MQTRGPDGFGGPLNAAVNRRQLLALAGTVGLASALSACSRPSEVANSATPENPSPSTSVPEPTAAPAATPGPAPPPAESKPPPVAVASQIICREAWRAQPAREGGVPHTPTRMTIHHTGVVLGDNRNAPARLRQHQQLHQNERGWIDIAYHVGIDRNGNIYELRDPGIKGDTATEYDTDRPFPRPLRRQLRRRNRHPRTVGRRCLGFCLGRTDVTHQPDRGRRTSGLRRHRMPGRRPVRLRRVGRTHTPRRPS